MAAQIIDGWVTLPCDASDGTKVHIRVGDTDYPAFRDTIDEQRVAKIRHPGSTGMRIHLIVNGAVTVNGRI